MQSNGRNTKRRSPIGQWRRVNLLWLVSRCLCIEGVKHLLPFYNIALERYRGSYLALPQFAALV
jgi:hypothetical protein